MPLPREDLYTLQQVTEILATNRLTLRTKWLAAAGITPASNPANRREKLLTWTQIQRLAAEQDRILPEPPPRPWRRGKRPPPPPAVKEPDLAQLKHELQRYIDEQFARLRAEVQRSSAGPPAAEVRTTVTPTTAPARERLSDRGAHRRPIPQLTWRFLGDHGVPKTIYETWLDVPSEQEAALRYALHHHQPLTPCTTRTCPCHKLRDERETT